MWKATALMPITLSFLTLFLRGFSNFSRFVRKTSSTKYLLGGRCDFFYNNLIYLSLCQDDAELVRRSS